MLALRGSVAVVTGASSGIGRRVAIELAGRGAVVTAIARREERLRQVAVEMQRSSPDSDFVVCDVSDTDRFAAVLAEIEARRGRIDLLVNNAAIGEEPAEGGLDGYRRVMETNFYAPVAGTMAVLPGMRARGHGAIVNVSSDAGRAPLPEEPAYSASKAALSAVTESLSYDAEQRGVHLHVLYPGWVPTEMTQGSGTDGANLPPKAVRRTDQQIARLLIDGAGGRRFELDATKVGRLAPLARALAPSLYRRALRRAAT